MYAAHQVGCGLARKYCRNLQKVPDLFKSMLKLMETQWLPVAGTDRQHTAFLLPLDSLRGTQLPRLTPSREGPASIENRAKFLLCHSVLKWGMQLQARG